MLYFKASVETRLINLRAYFFTFSGGKKHSSIKYAVFQISIIASFAL